MNNSEKWIDDTFKSVTQQNQPVVAPHLFAKIEEALNDVEVKVVPIFNWKIVAAASILLVSNLFVIQKISNNKLNEGKAQYDLIQNYNLYENE